MYGLTTGSNQPLWVKCWREPAESGVGVVRGAVLLGVDRVWVMVVVLGEIVVQPGGSIVPNVDGGLVALLDAFV